MARFLTRVILPPLLLLTAATVASAQPVAVPDTWGGDFWSRPRLTGSWGGFRDELGKKGVVLDLDLTLTPQGVLSGGRDTGADFWGNADYTLNIDTQKLGLWPGGFLPFLREQLGLGLDREDAVELYYNFAITGWLNATLDLQVIEPALQKTVGSSGRLEHVDTTVVAGLRLRARF